MAEELTQLQEADATVAEILTPIDFLGFDWLTGAQQALPDGTKLGRVFSAIQLDTSITPRIDYIETNVFDEELEGSSYFKVSQVFNEQLYQSGALDEYENFMVWEKSNNTHYHEVIYKNTVASTLRWDRSQTVFDSGSADSPFTYIPTTPTGTTTGSSSLRTRTVEGLQEEYYYNSISKPFKLSINAGKAIALEVESDAGFVLTQKASPTATGTVVSGIVVMDVPYLDISFSNPTNEVPTYVLVRFKGVEVSRGFNGRTTQEEPELLYHPSGVSDALRYLPPGATNFNQNFWNNAYFNKPAPDYQARLPQNPTFI